MSASQLEALFASSANDKKYRSGDRPKLWEKYRRGEVCPRIRGIGKKLSIVQKVDEEIPYASRWLTTSFWRLLSNQPLNMDEIQAVYLSLMPRIRNLIVKEDYTQSDVFWRIPSDSTLIAERLLSDDFCFFPYDDEGLDFLDCVTAVLAMIRELELTQDQKQHKAMLNVWFGSPDLLKQIPAFHNIKDEINKIVAKQFCTVRYFDKDIEAKWQLSKDNKFKFIPLHAGSSRPADV